MVLIFKVIAIFSAGAVVFLAFAGAFAIRAQSRAIKRSTSELQCPACNSPYSPEALKTARTKIENPFRELIEDGLRKLGIPMRTARTWDIICTTCGKTSRYDPLGNVFNTGKRTG